MSHSSMDRTTTIIGIDHDIRDPIHAFMDGGPPSLVYACGRCLVFLNTVTGVTSRVIEIPCDLADTRIHAIGISPDSTLIAVAMAAPVGVQLSFVSASTWNVSSILLGSAVSPVVLTFASGLPILCVSNVSSATFVDTNTSATLCTISVKGVNAVPAVWHVVARTNNALTVFMAASKTVWDRIKVPLIPNRPATVTRNCGSVVKDPFTGALALYPNRLIVWTDEGIAYLVTVQSPKPKFIQLDCPRIRTCKRDTADTLVAVGTDGQIIVIALREEKLDVVHRVRAGAVHLRILSRKGQLVQAISGLINHMQDPAPPTANYISVAPLHGGMVAVTSTGELVRISMTDDGVDGQSSRCLRPSLGPIVAGCFLCAAECVLVSGNCTLIVYEIQEGRISLSVALERHPIGVIALSPDKVCLSFSSHVEVHRVLLNKVVLLAAYDLPNTSHVCLDGEHLVCVSAQRCLVIHAESLAIMANVSSIGGPGFRSSLGVCDSIIHLLHTSGRVSTYDIPDGRKCAHIELGADIASAVGVGENRACVARCDGAVQRIDLSVRNTNTIVWTTKVPGPVNRMHYTAWDDSVVVCCPAVTVKLAWVTGSVLSTRKHDGHSIVDWDIIPTASLTVHRDGSVFFSSQPSGTPTTPDDMILVESSTTRRLAECSGAREKQLAHVTSRQDALAAASAEEYSRRVQAENSALRCAIGDVNKELERVRDALDVVRSESAIFTESIDRLTVATVQQRDASHQWKMSHMMCKIAGVKESIDAESALFDREMADMNVRFDREVARVTAEFEQTRRDYIESIKNRVRSEVELAATSQANALRVEYSTEIALSEMRQTYLDEESAISDEIGDLESQLRRINTDLAARKRDNDWVAQLATLRSGIQAAQEELHQSQSALKIAQDSVHRLRSEVAARERIIESLQPVLVLGMPVLATVDPPVSVADLEARFHLVSTTQEPVTDALVTDLVDGIHSITHRLCIVEADILRTQSSLSELRLTELAHLKRLPDRRRAIQLLFSRHTCGPGEAKKFDALLDTLFIE